MMEAALRTDVLNETYIDVEKLIKYTVHQFIRQYGGDFEELAAEANLLFIHAHDKYDESKGKLVSWIRFYISKNLLESLRRDLMRNKRVPRIALDLELVASTRREFKLNDLLEDVSNDAATVLRLAVETPIELRRQFEYKGGKPRNIRSCLRAFLIKAGWCSSRVTEAFEEIGSALIG